MPHPTTAATTNLNAKLPHLHTVNLLLLLLLTTPTPTPTPCFCYKSSNNTWAPSIRGLPTSLHISLLKHLHRQSSSILQHSSQSMVCLQHWPTDYTKPVIQNKQTNSCASYSTHVILCGTHPTASDDTPCIIMYVWRNLYVAMYHSPQSSSRKIPYPYPYPAYGPHASASKTRQRP